MKQYICKMCDKRLVGSVIQCIQCKKTVDRFCAIIYNKNKYELCNSNECFPTKPCDNQSVKYICKECNGCILGNVLCICCGRNVKRTSVVLFKKEKYDFENSMVSKLLLHVSGNSLNEKKNTFVKLAIKIFILELVENQKFQRH